ncbi:hypothetical protein BT96DRAFT_289867 [Gymnopus androsaceus JB14]|uniref:Uncharacterized protein n=1 Tax=Gymnopus androsaceus JB14 TaxID=1447944 RepID=A0A6A4H2T1_9AGAR|nr:hypothetical protein BT96DRAFT_289867 [Gymnopus androsaceus JB14]
MKTKKWEGGAVCVSRRAVRNERMNFRLLNTVGEGYAQSKLQKRYGEKAALSKCSNTISKTSCSRAERCKYRMNLTTKLANIGTETSSVTPAERMECRLGICSTYSFDLELFTSSPLCSYFLLGPGSLVLTAHSKPVCLYACESGIKEKDFQLVSLQALSFHISSDTLYSLLLNKMRFSVAQATALLALLTTVHGLNINRFIESGDLAIRTEDKFPGGYGGGHDHDNGHGRGKDHNGHGGHDHYRREEDVAGEFKQIHQSG